MTHNHSPKSPVGRQKLRFICNAPILETLNEILMLHACVPVQVKPACMCSGASKTCMLPPKCIQISTMPHDIPTTDFTSFGLVWILENPERTFAFVMLYCAHVGSTPKFMMVGNTPEHLVKLTFTARTTGPAKTASLGETQSLPKKHYTSLSKTAVFETTAYCSLR